jgi:hypothetical protein
VTTTTIANSYLSRFGHVFKIWTLWLLQLYPG